MVEYNKLKKQIEAEGFKVRKETRSPGFGIKETTVRVFKGDELFDVGSEKEINKDFEIGKFSKDKYWLHRGTAWGQLRQGHPFDIRNTRNRKFPKIRRY